MTQTHRGEGGIGGLSESYCPKCDVSKAFHTGWSVVKEDENRPKWSLDRLCPYLGREDGPKSCDAGPNSNGKICSDCFYDWHSQSGGA